MSEHAVLPPFVRAILDEVIGPDMIGPLGAKTDTGSVQMRPCLDCLAGTFSPSRGQIRSTRLSLTILATGKAQERRMNMKF
jgi:hypothetical protein